MYYMVDLPYTSIEDYDIDWAFWSSDNNATPHRTFEIRISKSELEGYATDTALGIMVGGYGTLASWPNTHNWVYANGTDTGIPYKETLQYYYYEMPMKVLPPTTTMATSTTTPETSSGVTTSTVTTTSTTTTTATTTPTSTTSITTNETTTPTPTPVDMTMVIVILGAGIVGIVVIVVIVKLRKS
jgi:hypothetical protein